MYDPNSLKLSLLEKIVVTRLVTKFPIFYGTRKYITIFTNTSFYNLMIYELVAIIKPKDSDLNVC